jgi:hypothetical protein
MVPKRSLLVHKIQLRVTGGDLNSLLFDGMPAATGNMWDDREDENTVDNAKD